MVWILSFHRRIVRVLNNILIIQSLVLIKYKTIRLLNHKSYLSIGVIWSDNEIIDNFAVVNQNTESYDNKYTA